MYPKTKTNNKIAKEMVSKLKDYYAAGKGTSKHAQIKANNLSANPDLAAALSEKIYSSSTMNRYIQAVRSYAAYQSQERGNSNKTSKALNPYEIAKYGEWLEKNGKSASTIKTEISAVCKVAGIGIKEFNDGKYGWKPPTRASSAFKNNRDSNSHNGRYNAEKHSDATLIGKTTGLRTSELKALRGTDLRTENGKFYVHVASGKGGKESLREVVGTPDQISRVTDLMRNAGGNKVISHIPSHFGEHQNRAEYAAAVYKTYARPQAVLDKIAKTNPNNKAIIITRIDRPGVPAGTVLDRKAAEKAAHELGHGSQRAATFLSSYAYKLFS